MEKITLPAMSFQMLKEVLGSPGWAGLEHIFLAGKILAEERIKLPPLPLPNLDEAQVVEFSPKEIAMIKVCLEANVARFAFPPTKYTIALLTQFGIEP